MRKTYLTGLIALALTIPVPVYAHEEAPDGERTFRCWRYETNVDTDKIDTIPIAVEAHTAHEALRKCIEVLNERRDRQRKRSAFSRFS